MCVAAELHVFLSLSLCEFILYSQFADYVLNVVVYLRVSVFFCRTEFSVVFQPVFPCDTKLLHKKLRLLGLQSSLAMCSCVGYFSRALSLSLSYGHFACHTRVVIGLSTFPLCKTINSKPYVLCPVQVKSIN